MATATNKIEENILFLNNAVVLNEDDRTALQNILRCAVCLDLPWGKQVHICEEGHHFCSSCHKKLNYCGICRGKLLKGRNFVVEELVKKFNIILSPIKSDLPPCEAPLKLTPGYYKCQHQCSVSIHPHKMIPHIRQYHSENFIENLRTNPYTKQFSWAFNVNFQPDQCYPFSVHISDLGLITVLVKFKGSDMFSYIKVLGDETISGTIKYQLIVKILSRYQPNPLFEFSVTECPATSYNDDFDTVIASGNFLQIKGSDLSDQLDITKGITVFFTLWKANSNVGKNHYLEMSSHATCVPYALSNNRRHRRNVSRNMRHRRTIEKYKQLHNIVDGIRRLEV